jgi:hypothetical protein
MNVWFMVQSVLEHRDIRGNGVNVILFASVVCLFDSNLLFVVTYLRGGVNASPRGSQSQNH